MFGLAKGLGRWPSVCRHSECLFWHDRSFWVQSETLSLSISLSKALFDYSDWLSNGTMAISGRFKQKGSIPSIPRVISFWAFWCGRRRRSIACLSEVYKYLAEVVMPRPCVIWWGYFVLSHDSGRTACPWWGLLLKHICICLDVKTLDAFIKEKGSSVCSCISIYTILAFFEILVTLLA